MGKYSVSKKKLYEEIIEQFPIFIENNHYKEGDRLPSLQELSEMFEVGKPTLREALSVLAATGILEIKHGSGIYFKRLLDNPVYDSAIRLDKVEGENLIHWFEYRRAIESEAARLAAKRCNEIDIKSIEEAQKRDQEDRLQGNTENLWDYQFHQRIALATHNPIFLQAVKPSLDAFKEYFTLSLRQSLALPARGEIAAKEHQEILDCIKKANASAAQKAMARHLDNATKKAKLLNNL